LPLGMSLVIELEEENALHGEDPGGLSLQLLEHGFEDGLNAFPKILLRGTQPIGVPVAALLKEEHPARMLGNPELLAKTRLLRATALHGLRWARERDRGSVSSKQRHWSADRSWPETRGPDHPARSRQRRQFDYPPAEDAKSPNCRGCWGCG